MEYLRNYHSSLSNNPEDLSLHLLHSRSLKTHHPLIVILHPADYCVSASLTNERGCNTAVRSEIFGSPRMRRINRGGTSRNNLEIYIANYKYIQTFFCAFIACTDTCITVRYSATYSSFVATDQNFDLRRILPRDISYCAVRGKFSCLMSAGKYYY
jgi:hypothetical protein